MTKLSLYLLGVPRVKLDEDETDVKPRKALALLLYLAMTAERHTRDALVTLLWPNSDQQAQLLDYLRPKALLLLIDNFEHLLDGAELLSEIITQASQVTVLVTSRERLNLQEEWMYEV